MNGLGLKRKSFQTLLQNCPVFSLKDRKPPKMAPTTRNMHHQTTGTIKY
jgi:hypothetical protein